MAEASVTGPAAASGFDPKLINFIPAAAYICDRDGLITHYNQRAVELWGHTPKLNHPEDRFCGAFKLFGIDGEPMAHAHCWMAVALETGQGQIGREIIMERPDGTRLTALAHANPLKDELGNIVGAINVLTDITERKHHEVERRAMLGNLQVERERLLEVFERSPAFMAVLRGPEHRFERMNGHYKEFIGGRDVIGKPIREALPEVNGQGYFAILDQVYRTGEPFVGKDMRVTLYKGPEGTFKERRVEFVFEPLKSHAGGVSGILIHGIDLTERLLAEEQLASVTAESERRRRLYETVLSTTPDLMYVVDLDYRFTYVNQALLDLWGKTWSQAIGRTCLELDYEPWRAELHERDFAEVVATKQAVRREVPFAGADGPRMYDNIFVPIFDAGGEVEAVAGATRDVTSRKRLEEELQRRADELAASDRKKDDFIALLAHELRNPLAPIRNGLRVMEMAGDNAETTAQVRTMMDRQLGHMVRIIDDLLDVSRITQNRLYLKRGRVLLRDVIDHAVEGARAAIEEAGHGITVELPPESVYLDADLTRLAQIFGNLLSNSTKYTGPGGHIWLSAHCEGGDVVVTVRDNGIGIPEPALAEIFGMFSQVDRAGEHSTGGLGIGLALVKTLVEMHGGSITAASEGRGNGSTFTVRLPMGTWDAGVATDKQAASECVDKSQRRVLVVDDNQDACHSMKMMLGLLGHDVHIAHDGLQGVAVAEQVQPDLVLMDVGMPHLNGYDATRRIREQRWGKSMVIVALTGWGQDADRTLSREAGCDGHLVKPVNLPDLEALMSQSS